LLNLIADNAAMYNIFLAYGLPIFFMGVKIMLCLNKIIRRNNNG
jgi:hypothetical protein